jgi:hypothetical protein
MTIPMRMAMVMDRTVRMTVFGDVLNHGQHRLGGVAFVHGYRTIVAHVAE